VATGTGDIVRGDSAAPSWDDVLDHPKSWPQLTPDAAGAFAAVQRSVWSAPGPARWLELTRRRLATLLRNPGELDRVPPGATGVADADAEALARWPSSPRFDPTERAALAIAERYVIDVAGTTDDERRVGFAALGDEVLAFVQGLYVLDMAQRIDVTATAVFGTGLDPSPARAPASRDLWSEIEAFMRTVARLDGLDPVTTEVVRLTGARQHDCRLCRSRRSAAAVVDLGDGTLFDDIVRGAPAALTADQHAAATLTEAMVTQPVDIGPDLVGRVRTSFSPGQAAEIVWDVARNGANKIAVLFGADEPLVSDGVEYFDLDASGDVVSPRTLPDPSDHAR
jgi:alkylhydroperoxidase family enzyme